MQKYGFNITRHSNGQEEDGDDVNDDGDGQDDYTYSSDSVRHEDLHDDAAIITNVWSRLSEIMQLNNSDEILESY